MTFSSRQVVPAVLLALFVVFPAAAASKRRAVTPRSPGDKFTTDISGRITDAATGAPVRFAKVSGGRRSTTTDENGDYDFKAEGFGDVILFNIERSGYELYRERIVGTGPYTRNLQLAPTPTVTVRKSDNSTVKVDFESLKFGYAVPFSGYRSAETEQFCLPNGSTVDVHRYEMKRIAGPGVDAASSCCTARNAMKVTLELKNGQTTDAYFIDTCETDYDQLLIAVEHDSGTAIDIPFSEISEIIFP